MELEERCRVLNLLSNSRTPVPLHLEYKPVLRAPVPLPPAAIPRGCPHVCIERVKSAHKFVARPAAPSVTLLDWRAASSITGERVPTHVELPAELRFSFRACHRSPSNFKATVLAVETRLWPLRGNPMTLFAVADIDAALQHMKARRTFLSGFRQINNERCVLAQSFRHMQADPLAQYILSFL